MQPIQQKYVRYIDTEAPANQTQIVDFKFRVKLLHDSVGQGVILCKDDHVIDIKTNNCSAKGFMFKVNTWILATLFKFALQ